MNGHQIAIHNKGQEFICDLCEKVYSRKFHLKEHKNTVHFDLNVKVWGKKFRKGMNLLAKKEKKLLNNDTARK